AMEFSAIDPPAFHLLASASQIKNDGGEPFASPEAYLSTFVTFPDDRQAGEKRGVVRGVRPIGLAVHDRVRIVEGRAPGRGFEAIVGKLVATKLGVSPEKLAPGRAIEFEGQRWTIVGVFDAAGSVLEAEIWGHLDDVLVASKRTDYSAVIVKARS